MKREYAKLHLDAMREILDKIEKTGDLFYVSELLGYVEALHEDINDLIRDYRNLSAEYWRLKMMAETEEQYNHYDALEAYYDELIEFLIHKHPKGL